MALASFVHLRVHSAYSLSEGALRIAEIVERCRAFTMPAVAVTDTSNLFGAPEFSNAAATAGIQPIIGCQLSVAREDDEGRPGNGARFGSRLRPDKLVLLVQNERGYRNLLKLVSLAYLGSDDVDEPQVGFGDLERYGDGLILLTGGPDGPVGRRLRDRQPDAARATLKRLARAFPGRTYVEVMRHGLECERVTEPAFVKLAYELDLPLVATNEAFFGDAEMYEAHDVLICIAEGARVSEGDRRRLTPKHGFKSPAEMRELFKDLPEAIDNTLVIALRCAFMIENVDPILPPYDCGEGRTEEDELRALASAGLDRRLNARVFTEGMSDAERMEAARRYGERLGYELDMIVKLGFPGYFLIVADFIRWAKEQGIPVGPGRGSGAGSVVAWALTITDLDPLRWGLLFERFLNLARVSMPDFDIDFCQERRDAVIRYVQDRYGRDHVAQIITFGKLQARAALRDVGRVLDMPYGYVDKICKLVPNNPASPATLDQAIAGEPHLQRMIQDDPAVARLVSIAQRLEGLYRHASTHAAGVVIGDRPLDQLIPLYRDARSDMPVTGFNMKYVEAAGLVKFDFLGLKTLSVLHLAEEMVRRTGRDIDVNHLPLDDGPTYEMIGHGETTGVFQLESVGMRDVLRGLKPDTFEDIIAVVALYRPGPMDNIPSYVLRKHGRERPDYLYPTLEGILKETFGIIIYQEQVMQIAQELSGYSLGDADILRRAMGKKIKSEMAEQRQTFVDGAKNRGVPEAKASEIFDLVAKFAGYGFNKSHAAAYALVAYNTAYMKAHFPIEFLAASMTFDMGNTDKLNVFRQELDRLGVPLLPPDINASRVEFAVEHVAGEGTQAIRYALAAIRNVGRGAMESLVAERTPNGPFRDLSDLSVRLDPRSINRRQLESLVRSGALDCLNPNRRQTFESIDTILRHANASRNDRDSDQIGLFGATTAEVHSIQLADHEDWPSMERLREEFDAIGFYLSAHPLQAFQSGLRRLGVKTAGDVLSAGSSGTVHLAGTVIGKRERTSAKGNRYAFVQLSDTSGVYEVTVFSELLGAHPDLLEVGTSVYLTANVQPDGESVRLTAQAIEPLEEKTLDAAGGLVVYVDCSRPLAPLKDVLAREGKGRGNVSLVSRLEDETEVEIGLPGGFSLSPELHLAIRSLPGVLDVHET